MHTTRLMTNAFLFNESEILLLHRAWDRILHPGLWTGVGGHVEPSELGDPTTSCLREIAEETSIGQGELSEFRLRYIMLRQQGTEIRQQYVFIGITKTRRLRETDEGALEWIPVSDILQLDLIPTTRLLLKHFLSTPPGSRSAIWVGVVSDSRDNQPQATWSQLREWK
jgi:8-oxo-dGTP diphosphatase